MIHTVKHHKLFEKEILKTPRHHQEKTYKFINKLKENPKVLPQNTESFRGYKNTYRTRIGNFRFVYQINHIEKTIFILGIQSRGSVYKLISRILR